MVRRLVLLLLAATLWFGALAQGQDAGPAESAQIAADDRPATVPQVAIVAAPLTTGVVITATPPVPGAGRLYRASVFRPPRTLA